MSGRRADWHDFCLINHEIGNLLNDVYMKTVRISALLILLSILPMKAWSAEVSLQPENLTALVSAALANNPELKASESRWQMFASKVKQAGAFDDPMIMLKVQNTPAREPLVFNKDPQSAKVIGISQQIPFWGKRALRRDVARYEADSYHWAFEERKLELTRMIKESYYQLWAVDKGLEIVSKNLRILTDFVTITELKYSVGQGVQQDIFKAGLEKSKMLDMQITLQQQRKSLEATLNYLLCRPGNTPVGPVADFSMPFITLSREQLNAAALDQRPQVKSLFSLENKAEASHRLAQKERYPDFNLSAEYMIRDAVATEMATDPGDNMVSVGVTFNLPFQQGKRQAMVAESTFEKAMAGEELNALKNTISYTINESLAQLERRRKLVELYKGGLIPQAAQSLQSALIGYRVGKVDFLTLLDSRMNLFNLERELYESQAEYMMKLAQLEAAVGTVLTAASQTSTHHDN
jgi:cobalt-zinc-cadmium efflux system outer membrane protein